MQITFQVVFYCFMIPLETLQSLNILEETEKMSNSRILSNCGLVHTCIFDDPASDHSQLTAWTCFTRAHCFGGNMKMVLLWLMKSLSVDCAHGNQFYFCPSKQKRLDSLFLSMAGSFITSCPLQGSRGWIQHILSSTFKKDLLFPS